ncbi:acyltransferase family protein [Salmonirosea aquatica]
MPKNTPLKNRLFIPLGNTSREQEANNFDFMRFLGACLVIYGHAYPLSGRGTFDHIQLWTRGIFPTAHMGVAIFFVISGFLISQSISRSPSALNFLWKRAVRIFPGLFVAALVTVFVLGAMVTSLPLGEYFTLSETYRYLLVTKLYPPYPDTLPGVFNTSENHTVNGSLWTLAYEFTCYFALLAVNLLFPAKFRKQIILTCFIVTWLSYPFWVEPLSGSSFQIPLFHLRLFNLVDFGMYFVAGCVAFHYRQYILYKGYLALSFFSFWIGTYLLAESSPSIPLSCVVWARYLAIPYLVLYLSFIRGHLNGFGRFGDLSYGLYIYAFPIQRIVVSVLGATAPIGPIILLSFLCVLPFAWLSWNFVEKPCLRLKGIVA